MMKAWSAREADEDDLRELWTQCGWSSAAEALDAIEAAYPRATLKPVSRYLVESVANDATRGIRQCVTPLKGGMAFVNAHSRLGRPVDGYSRKRPR
jgi:hypothetical protein